MERRRLTCGGILCACLSMTSLICSWDLTVISSAEMVLPGSATVSVGRSCRSVPSVKSAISLALVSDSTCACLAASRACLAASASALALASCSSMARRSRSFSSKIFLSASSLARRSASFLACSSAKSTFLSSLFQVFFSFSGERLRILLII